jgi:tRNA 2-thiouridine synthesizing protein E
VKETIMDTHNVDARLQELSDQVALLLARQERSDELWGEVMPIGRELMRTAATRLDDAEKKGYFEVARELISVGQRVLEHYSAEDVRRLGDAIVMIIDGVRALTQPSVMALAADAARAIDHADQARPTGFMGLVRSTRDEDVQRGIGVLLEVLRKVGQGVQAMTVEEQKGLDRKARLAKALGPRRGRDVLGIERTVPVPRVQAAPAPKTCAVPKPAAAATVVDGIGFTADGYMTDATQWNKTIAETLAIAQAISLTDAHWKVLEAARADFAKANASPNIRRLTQIQPLTTKDLYGLFPRAPGRTIAKIAGLPKPAGCL